MLSTILLATWFLLISGKKAARCQECLKTLEVPSDEFDADNFSAQDFTKLKNRGGLRFASTPFFSLLQQVEKVINDFCSQGKIFCENAFQDILYGICDDSLTAVGCDEHRLDVMMNVIHSYVLCRFKFIIKEKKRELCLAQKTTALTKKHFCQTSLSKNSLSKA